MVQEQLLFKEVRDRSAIMECEVKFGAKILPAHSPLDIKVKQQLQSGENASLYQGGSKHGRRSVRVIRKR